MPLAKSRRRAVIFHAAIRETALCENVKYHETLRRTSTICLDTFPGGGISLGRNMTIINVL
jgi:hypothetical protein